MMNHYLDEAKYYLAHAVPRLRRAAEHAPDGPKRERLLAKAAEIELWIAEDLDTPVERHATIDSAPESM